MHLAIAQNVDMDHSYQWCIAIPRSHHVWDPSSTRIESFSTRVHGHSGHRAPLPRACGLLGRIGGAYSSSKRRYGSWLSMMHSHTERSKGFSVVHCLDVLEGTSFPTQALGLPCGSKKRPTRHQKIWTHNISAGIPSEVFITVIDASLWSIIKDRGNCQVLATYVPMHVGT